MVIFTAPKKAGQKETEMPALKLRLIQGEKKFEEYENAPKKGDLWKKVLYGAGILAVSAVLSLALLAGVGYLYRQVVLQAF